MDKTGRAIGSLSPVIYFYNPSMTTIMIGPMIVRLGQGHILIPPCEIGHGDETARMMYEGRYKDKGYQWREAGTLNEVDRLQRMLVDQEGRILEAKGAKMDNAREIARQQSSRNLRQRMASGSCSAFERDFIRNWLDMNEEKRKKYNQRFTEYQSYLWAREQDSGTTVEDRMKD